MNRWERLAVLGATAAVVGALVMGCGSKNAEAPGGAVGNGDKANSSPVAPSRHPHEGLDQTRVPELQKLAQYEKQYGPLVDQMMLFTDTPRDEATARQLATTMAAKLKEFDRVGVAPLVIMEPVAGDTALDFNKYQAGAYDAALNAYFSELKTQGITDSALGTVVIFPEANSPEWGQQGNPSSYITNPAVVSDCITRTARIQKDYFPHSRASIMLNSESYPDGDPEGEHGVYKPLDIYTSRIPKGLIDSVGLQGFPWTAPANQPRDTSYVPKQFLNAGMLMRAAQPLGVRDLWFNTGTFASIYASDPSQTVHMAAAQRGTMLEGVLDEARYASEHGYDVTVNIFAADKAGTEEATDWSYGDPESQAVFRNFATQAAASHLHLSLFDTTEQ